MCATWPSSPSCGRFMLRMVWFCWTKIPHVSVSFVSMSPEHNLRHRFLKHHWFRGNQKIQRLLLTGIFRNDCRIWPWFTGYLKTKLEELMLKQISQFSNLVHEGKIWEQRATPFFTARLRLIELWLDWKGLGFLPCPRRKLFPSWKTREKTIPDTNLGTFLA